MKGHGEMENILYADQLISVVMPAFNAEKTIGQAIRSVLNQTHKKLELIIIDDASTDKTLPIATEYAQTDARIRILRNSENSGVSCSRNSGVKAASAEWIAFLDSDDMWMPDKLERQCRTVLNSPSCSICFTGSSFTDERGQPCDYTLSVPGRLTYYDLLKQNLISCSSVLVKKKLLEKYPMAEDPMIHEDLATWLNILKYEPYAVGINEPLLIYRFHKSSKSGNKLRAAKMQWKTYQTAGISRIKSIPYFVIYAWRNIKKYLHIQKGLDRMC